VKLFRCGSFLLAVAAACVALAGCGSGAAKSDAKGAKAKDLPSFKEGKGLLLPEETRKSIGLELAEVSERNLNRRLVVEVQVYERTTGGVWRASGLVSKRQAEWLHPRQPAALSSRDGQTMEGKLAGVDGQTQAVTEQTELIFEMPAAGSGPGAGDFFTATMTATNKEATTAIPSSALLRSAQGDFVYVANGERLLRTAVTAGDEGEGFVQITDGLYAGDKVVVKPVEMLWLTELRLAAAGGDKD
jgi:hypothetical protein